MTTIILRLRTPHGAPVTGATVAVAGNQGALAGVEQPQHPGRYRLELPEAGGYHLTIQRTADETGFDHRTLRGSCFITDAAPGRPPLLKIIRGLESEGSRLVRARWTGQRFLLDAVMDYLWFTPMGRPPTLGNAVSLLIEGKQD